jgi:hypothetical protein
MELARVFAGAFGQGEVLAWGIGEKALAAQEVELRHLIWSRVRPESSRKESAEYVEDDPPPRALPGTTADGKKSYPEQKLTAQELETGVKGQDLPEAIAKGIRKAKAVVEEPTGTTNNEEEAVLADPMVVETEETYLQAFDLDSAHLDAAMREAGDDWLQMDACGEALQKHIDKAKYVDKKAWKSVEINKLRMCDSASRKR